MPSSVRKGPRPGSFNKAKRSESVVADPGRAPTRVEVALDGPNVDGDRPVTPDEWERLRQRTWERWLALIAKPHDGELPGRQIAAREGAIERGVRLTPSLGVGTTTGEFE